MSARCVVYAAVSLDGFLSRPDGSLDWLDAAAAAVPPGEDHGFAALLASVDAMVMGRATFDHVLGFGAWPYGDLPVEVLTSRPLALPEGFPGKVHATAAAPVDLVQRLGRAGARRVYVDGGKTVQAFLGAGLVDEITLTVIPVLLGEGRRLFGPLPGDRALHLVSSRAYPSSGFVQLTYRLQEAPS